MEKFNLVCKCGQQPEIFLRHDGGCGDPDCCGGRNYYGITIKCKCGILEEIDCEDEP